MTDSFDCIVVGAGHNGLVCAALLAKAGQRVLVLEANDKIGGAAVTREFTAGYQVSACAHLLYQLQPEVRRELDLSPGLAAEDMTTIALGSDGKHLRMRGDGVEGVSPEDAEAYRRFRKRMQRFAKLLRRYLVKPPPRLGTKDFADLATLARLGLDIRLLGREEMQEFLRLIGMNIHDEVTERFASPLLRGAVGLDAVLGTHLGPRSPNTILTYLYRLAGEKGRLSAPRRGMGSITEQIGMAARNAGVEIRTSTPVKRIVVDNGRVTGVETTGGEVFSSTTVVSNADPKRTVFGLTGARNFETGFLRRLEHLRTGGNAAKLHLALDHLPTFDGLAESDLDARIVIAGDEHYVERAFNPAKYGEFSPDPVIEMTFPSTRDETLAPQGKHVMSAVVQFAPYALRKGWDDAAKAEFLETIMATIERYAPDIRSCVSASELLTPLDLENEFHITGGHWHHAELTLDQFLFVRPIGGAQQYALPLDGLWLCGAGTHPGGGVSGAAGRNAAHCILRREKTR